MRANGIEMGVSSGGTGALTLSAKSGKPTYASVFGSSGTMMVEYVGEDGNLLETGYGTIDLSTLVLTRGRILSTWDGSVYSRSNPTALNFSTSATIRCSNAAEFNTPTINEMVRGFSDDGGTLPLNWHGGFGGTLAVTATRLYLIPMLWTGTGEIDRVMIRINTGVASSSIKCALYDVGTDGLPLNLLRDFGSISTTSAAGVALTAPTSFTELPLAPGWYYQAMLCTHGPTVRAYTLMNPGPCGVSGAYSGWLYSTESTGYTHTSSLSGKSWTSAAGTHPGFSIRTRG